jgi:hypothetical protein
MGIRKHGSATGEVTEVEPQEGLTVTASAGEWTPGDEGALTEENEDAAE